MKSILFTCCTLLIFLGWSDATHGRQADFRHLGEELPLPIWQLKDEHLYTYRYDMDGLNWRQIREQRRRNREAGQATKYFELKQMLKSPHAGSVVPFSHDVLQGAIAVVRDPNGEISRMTTWPDSESAVKIPKKNNLIGRYLLGGHVQINEADVDHDGTLERIHLCAKYLIGHYVNGGAPGNTSVVFIDDPTLMPLEIGPVINTAKSKYGGAYQRPHRFYEMMVKYEGDPLPGCYVRLISLPGQWEKAFVTDAQGIFKVMPMDDRELDLDEHKYLFAAFHLDHEKKACFVSTFPVNVLANRPEWRSKVMGFVLWAIVGSMLTLIMVWALVKRRENLHRKAMIVFEDHKIRQEGE